MDPTTYAVIAAAVLVGLHRSSRRSSLGVGLVAAPVTKPLLDRALMPSTLLMVATLNAVPGAGLRPRGASTGPGSG